MDGGFLDFSSAPVVRVQHRGYNISFVNFAGDDYHIGRKIITTKPDVVLDVVDSLHLEDSLDLTSRLIDMDLRTALVFSRYDGFLATGHSIDYDKFSEMVGIPSMTLGKPDEASRSRFLSMLVDVFETPPDKRKHVHVPYGPDLDAAISDITGYVTQSPSLGRSYHDRYLAVRLLEDPEYIYEAIKDDVSFPAIAARAAVRSGQLARQYGETTSELVRKARFGFVRGALQETVAHGPDKSDHKLIDRVDAVLTSRLTGFPILFLILFIVFQATFALGSYPQEWIENGVSALVSLLKSSISTGWLSSLLADGVVQGVGAVLAFLPNIIILFFFLSILEDTGYMARAAFLMDGVMHRIGLHGRSFIPMLLGFGCNVPAIMSARAIEDRRDRTLTMLMIPFMSCSARLPVYLLLVSVFFEKYKALVMVSIYLLGIVLSILFAFVMKRTRFFRKDDSDFVSELPSFRIPTWRNTGAHIWERCSDYLKKISTVILAASVIIWALEYFPADRTLGGTVKEESCLAAIGRGVAPLTAPLGFDWKMNVCLLTGLPAKEAIVSTMGILYHTDDDSSLIRELRDSGAMTPGSALAFMVFVLLYFPCIATIATLRREVGGRWAAFTVIHSLLLAWVVAYAVNNIFAILQ